MLHFSGSPIALIIRYPGLLTLVSTGHRTRALLIGPAATRQAFSGHQAVESA